MTLNPKELIIKAPSLTDESVATSYVRSINGADKSKSAAFVKEVFRLYPESGYSPEIVIAQWDLETGTGTTQPWLTRNNPAGIGITDGGDSGHSWPTPAAAAQAQTVHLSGYVDGYVRSLRSYLDQDPRYLLLLKTDYAQSVHVVDDLTGKWATDPQYGIKIAGRLERMRSFIPTPKPPVGTIVFGRVPRPAIVDRTIPDANNWAWDDLGQRTIRGIVYHRQLGTNWGTDGWFRGGGGGKGLTDYGIDNNTGEILKWNDPYGVGKPGVSPNRSGWASGGSGGESGDGIAFVKKFGRVSINRNLASLEIAGNYNSPISQACFDKVVALTAHLADANRVPWTDYPLNPNTGLIFTYWHNEFQREKPCPGDVVMDETDDIRDAVKDVLRQYQTG